jgi:hypothetical protein
MSLEQQKQEFLKCLDSNQRYVDVLLMLNIPTANILSLYTNDVLRQKVQFALSQLSVHEFYELAHLFCKKYSISLPCVNGINETNAINDTNDTLFDEPIEVLVDARQNHNTRLSNSTALSNLNPNPNPNPIPNPKQRFLLSTFIKDNYIPYT